VILVRDIFQLHFGKAREAIALAKEERTITERAGGPPARILTDLVGDYYTLVMETEVESLGQLDELLSGALQDPEWKEWFARFTPLVREGRREILRVVD
jgi:hypothetical protein